MPTQPPPPELLQNNSSKWKEISFSSYGELYSIVPGAYSEYDVAIGLFDSFYPGIEENDKENLVLLQYNYIYPYMDLEYNDFYYDPAASKTYRYTEYVFMHRDISGIRVSIFVSRDLFHVYADNNDLCGLFSIIHNVSVSYQDAVSIARNVYENECESHRDAYREFAAEFGEDYLHFDSLLIRISTTALTHEYLYGEKVWEIHLFQPMHAYASVHMDLIYNPWLSMCINAETGEVFEVFDEELFVVRNLPFMNHESSVSVEVEELRQHRTIFQT